MKKVVFARLHWSNSPEFDAANAWSMPWGEEDGEPLRGYSCCSGEDEADALETLWLYFDGRGGCGEGQVIVFEGSEVGRGPDCEPLVVPSRVVRTLTTEEFERWYAAL